MKTLIFVFFCINLTFSQETYYDNVSASQIINVIDKVGFEAKSCTNNTLSSAILQLPDNGIQQLNISSWHLCNNRQDDIFNNYNLFYKPISRTTFNLYCKELSSLMMCDGTYKQPR